MIRIVERDCAALERSLVKVPFWRGELPNELRELAPVFFVALPTTLGCEIVLVPPLVLVLGCKWDLTGLLVADQVATDRDERIAALRPESGNDVRRACSP